MTKFHNPQYSPTTATLTDNHGLLECTHCGYALLEHEEGSTCPERLVKLRPIRNDAPVIREEKATVTELPVENDRQLPVYAQLEQLAKQARESPEKYRYGMFLTIEGDKTSVRWVLAGEPHATFLIGALEIAKNAMLLESEMDYLSGGEDEND